MILEKYTFGMGDRFAHEGKAQLGAVMQAQEAGVDVYPVWNKSNREHVIVGSRPDELRKEADEAVRALGWQRPYYVDADHVGLKTVDWFVEGSNFFTLDVADCVGQPASHESVEAFVRRMEGYGGVLVVPGLQQPFEITRDGAREAAGKFLRAMQEAGKIYRHIVAARGGDDFVTEVSVDETDAAQTPVELFYILAMLAEEGVPLQTIAPKFTGRFNKGVDYVGDLARFETEFEEDLCVLAFAKKELGLPANLKLSIHSGSDKFSLYPVIKRLIRKHDAGLHVKTAGTTWLAEVSSLATAGNDGLEIAKDVYCGALEHFEELTAPYATVIDIDRAKLPAAEDVRTWDAGRFFATLEHDQSNPLYNPHFRQLIHVGFKVAAKMGSHYTDALGKYQDIVGHHVQENLLERHILPIFGR